MAKASEEEGVKRKKSGKGLVLIAGLNLLGLGAVVFFLVTQLDLVDARVIEATKELENRVVEEEPTVVSGELTTNPTSGPTVDIGSVNTMLRTEGEEARLIRLRLVVELDNEIAKSEAEQKLSQLRFYLERVLAAEEISSVQGEELAEIRAKLTRRADAVLSSQRGRVINVWPRGWSFVN